LTLEEYQIYQLRVNRKGRSAVIPARHNGSKTISPGAQIAQVALVTGGGQGLGAATARALARRGWRVAVADINRKNAERVATSCDPSPSKSMAVVVNLAQPRAPRRMVDAVVRAWGRIDVLINCAAVAPVEAFLEMTPEAWELALAVNVRGVALAMSAAGRVMAAQGCGHIVNITSAAARMGLPHFAAYAATKAAVDSLTRCGAVALAPMGVRVNGFSPGMMDTPLQVRAEAIFCRLDGRDDVAAYKAERTRRVPVGRRTSPEEMAEAITWLAVDAPHYMTAERMNVTGGHDKD